MKWSLTITVLFTALVSTSCLEVAPGEEMIFEESEFATVEEEVSLVLGPGCHVDPACRHNCKPNADFCLLQFCAQICPSRPAQDHCRDDSDCQVWSCGGCTCDAVSVNAVCTERVLCYSLADEFADPCWNQVAVCERNRCETALASF